MIDTVTVFLLSFIFAFVFLWLQRRRESLKVFDNSNIPVVKKPNIIFGNLPEIGKENVQFITRKFAELGNTFGYFIGTRPYFATKDTKLLKKIMISDYQSFMNRPKMLIEVFCIYPKLKLALMFIRDREWSLTRSMLRLSFSSKRLKSMSTLVNDCVDCMLTRINKIENTEIDISVYLKECTLDVISRAAFGFVIDPAKKGDRKILKAFNDVLGTDLSFMEILLVLFPEFYPQLNWMRRKFHLLTSNFYQAPESVLYDICYQLINMRRNGNQKLNDLLEAMLSAEEDLAQSKNEVDDFPTKDDGADDFEKRSELNQGSKKMTESEIAANSVAFLIAGYETSSTTLAFVAHNLVNFPEVQEKVRDEARALIEKYGKIGFNVFHELPYLEAVIEETLRLYPAATFIASRESSVDYKHDNITIPRGSFIVIPIQQLHRDPQLWDEPEKFDPDRFLGENRIKINRMAYMPFGTGPRNCIGLRFAVLLMKLLIAKLLLEYELVPTGETEIGECSIVYKQVVMAPKKGPILKIVPINK